MHRLVPVIACFVLIASCARDNRGLVVGKIQQASKLATTEFTIDKLVYGTKKKDVLFFIPWNETRIVAYSQIIVKSGINLKKLKTKDIIIDGSSIEVTLPPVEVINFSYPTEKIRIDHRLSDTKKLFNAINILDLEELLRQAETDVRDQLEHMGIVETTQDKTRALLVSLLKNLGYEEIHVGFTSDKLIVDRVGTGEEQPLKESL